MPAKEQKQGGKQAAACPPAHRQAALGLLPPQPMAEVFASLCASDAGRAAVVCKAWHAAATGEAVAWDLAITELDPFCALGGSELARGRLAPLPQRGPVVAALRCGPHWLLALVQRGRRLQL
jgi:hypothetical protein